MIAAEKFVGTASEGELSEEERSKTGNAASRAIFAVGVAFFLAELGDKTMLATIALATQGGCLGTWIGSTLGMVAADALAIGVRAPLGAVCPRGRSPCSRCST